MPPANSPSQQQNVSTPAYLLPAPNQSTAHAEPTQSQLFSLHRAEDLGRLGAFLDSRENALRAGETPRPYRLLGPPNDSDPPRLPASQIISRTLPLPESDQSGQSFRQAYGTRPPRRQSEYDWAPQVMDPFTDLLSEHEQNRILGSDMLARMNHAGTGGGTEDLSDSDLPPRRRLLRRRSRMPPNDNTAEGILERAMRLRRQTRSNFIDVARHYEQIGRQVGGLREAGLGSLSLLSIAHKDILDNIIVYLSRIRFCRGDGEARKIAEKLLQSSRSILPGSPSSPVVDITSDDLLTSTRCLKVTKTSWLRADATFKGSQSTDNHPPGDELHSGLNTGVAKDWMVTVKITGIDYDNMTLTGTMEANGVWGPPENATKTIVTYLEGEIIDFYTHTLNTTNFDTEPHTDASYWASLDPLRGLSRESLPRHLTSRAYMEKLSKEWVLMRWKEKCFLSSDGPSAGDTTTDGSNMLTISGFYYLSMRRSDGAIQGLYYDPNATPHQELRLKPVKAVNQTFPTYKLR